MWDVYIWEAHPGDPAPKPKTFEERIRNYERYKNDKNMTMPALIDSIRDQWSRSWWDSKPTTMYMIGVDGKIFEIFNFMLGGGYYPRIETALEKAIKEIVIDNEPPVVQVKTPQQNDEWTVGKDYTITWTATDNVGVEKQAIYLSTDNGSNWEIIDSLDDNSQSLDWTVPDKVSDNCKIKVFSYDAMDNVGNAESATFKIKPATNINYKLDVAYNKIELLKTPASYRVFLPFEGSNRIVITDVMGKQMANFVTSEIKQWYTIPKPVSSGMHIMSIFTKEKTISKKLWLIK